LSVLSFYGQLLKQLSVVSLSGPTVFLQCYSLLLLYFGQINDDDDANSNNNFIHLIAFLQCHFVFKMLTNRTMKVFMWRWLFGKTCILLYGAKEKILCCWS